MMDFNDWLPSALGRARRLYEDSDRKHFVDHVFNQLLRDVHQIATSTAVRTPAPSIERYQTDDGVVINMEWYDPDSAWHLYFGVRRTLGQKPVVIMDFYSANKAYASNRPGENDMRMAITDYFESWK